MLRLLLDLGRGCGIPTTLHITYTCGLDESGLVSQTRDKSIKPDPTNHTPDCSIAIQSFSPILLWPATEVENKYCISTKTTVKRISLSFSLLLSPLSFSLLLSPLSLSLSHSHAHTKFASKLDKEALDSMRESVSSWTASIGKEKEVETEKKEATQVLIGPRPPSSGPLIGPMRGPTIGPVQVVTPDHFSFSQLIESLLLMFTHV